MTMRSYDDIEFRPWYLPDTARWLKLSLGARGLVAELLRKLDRHGRIALGEDPASDLAVILRLDEAETRKAMTELLAAGRLVWDPVERLLSDPDLPARMRLGSAARMAKSRAKVEAAKAAKAQAANDAVTPAPESASHPSQAVTRVTLGVSPSPSDLPLISSGSDLLKADQEIPPVPARARWEGNAGMRADAKGVYEVAVTETLQRIWRFPNPKYHLDDLLRLLSDYGPPEADSARSWLNDRVRTWVRSADDPKDDWHPKRLAEWLNRGGKSAPAPRSKVDTRQPQTGPEPKWLADAKAGRTGTGNF